jgi:multimeric flavodoxin WrbA
MNTRVQIIFYSMYGHVYRLADAAAQGAKEVAGVEASIFQVPELVPDNLLEQSAQRKPVRHSPISR